MRLYQWKEEWSFDAVALSSELEYEYICITLAT